MNYDAWRFQSIAVFCVTLLLPCLNILRFFLRANVRVQWQCLKSFHTGKGRNVFSHAISQLLSLWLWAVDQIKWKHRRGSYERNGRTNV